MEYHVLGKTGLKVSMMGLGGIPIQRIDAAGTRILIEKLVENGINYKNLTTAMPYMFSDTPETIEILAKDFIIDQVIDWFGKDIKIIKTEKEEIYKIILKSSPTAMLFWAMQYTDECEVIKPITLREKIKETIKKAKEKYEKLI